MAELSSSKMDLHALIKDNIRALYPNCSEPLITLATHDQLWWVVISKHDGPIRYIRSPRGFETPKAALEDTLGYLSEEIWSKLKEKNISLAK